MKLQNLFKTYNSLQELAILSVAATKTPEPALHFFLQNARNNFFDLEATFRIFRKTHGKDQAESLMETYKEAEDALGKYDFENTTTQLFLKNSELPVSIKESILLSEKKAYIELKQFLHKNKWLPDATNSITEQKNKMEEILSVSYADFRDDFIDFLSKTARKTTEQYQKGELDPHLLEEGIHEIRRKIRWLSIYIKISGGIIQTKKNDKQSSEYKKYLREDILASPFMKIPPSHNSIKPLLIQFENFAALSWMIQELGQLKDQGLTYERILQLTKSESKSTTNALLKTHHLHEGTLDEIKEKAESISNDFFLKDDILSRLAADFNQNK